ncbi:MAG TPA: AAA family ATPase [Miltoncostaeaceae bacterium]|nr:AAA family ATPase [Miltoncostaeaceae bacterium]
MNGREGDGYAVRRLELTDLRIWRRVPLELPRGLVVITGPNGAGKTSLIEAIVFGCLGVSPRTAREQELVRTGASAVHVRLLLEGPRGVTEREIGFAPGRSRRLRRDGEPVRSLSDWRARVLLVFLPEELRAVKGPPAARRRALDRVLEAADPAFASTLAEYQRATAQRNALLRRIRSGQADERALGVWEEAMAHRGAAVPPAPAPRAAAPQPAVSRRPRVRRGEAARPGRPAWPRCSPRSRDGSGSSVAVRTVPWCWSPLRRTAPTAITTRWRARWHSGGRWGASATFARRRPWWDPTGTTSGSDADGSICGGSAVRGNSAPQPWRYCWRPETICVNGGHDRFCCWMMC